MSAVPDSPHGEAVIRLEAAARMITRHARTATGAQFAVLVDTCTALCVAARHLEAQEQQG